MIEKLADILRYDAGSPLLFNTGLFLVLFGLFLVVYQLLRGHRRLKMGFVIVFSLYFYYKSSAECCFILLGVCLFDFLLGLGMGHARTNWIRRLIVFVNVAINVAMLGYFKYFNLLIETINSILSVRIGVADIVLPAGISFFTFRSISYIVDLYRRQMEPCTSLLDYTFYLTFFPPLLAGPVVRAKDMLPQVKGAAEASRTMVGEGLFLIICGIIKKVVVADYISGNFVDRIFDNPALYSGFENLLGMYGFTIQLYCDFSGYSDMAIGIALLLGFRFADNFNAPFKAESPTEFWRRWHISLSTWLRDYVYIPLGGNRKGRVRSYFNQFATMVVGGLWHGASWMYVIWGAAHGGLLIAHKSATASCPKQQQPSPWWRRMVNIIITFNLIAVLFALFRMQSFQGMAQMFGQIFGNFHLSVAPQFCVAYVGVVVLMAVSMLLHFLPSRLSVRTRGVFSTVPLWMQSLILAVVILIAIQMRQSDIVPFIYLQY